MNEINKINLSEQTKFRLSEIIGIENYFHQEINQRKSCSKKLSKYVTTFGYIDKVLVATSGGVSIISFILIITLIYSLSIGIVKKLLSTTRNRKKKHKILMLVKIKLNSIETLITKALIDMKISHGEFIVIFKEKEKYEKMKEKFKK